MPVLPNDAIRRLLQPFVTAELPDPLISQLSIYLDLLVRWNARVSLTSIRTAEEMVQRHFGESLFTAEKLATRLAPGDELLDYGSGPGFPGLPIQLRLPALNVTLAESQTRKVAFLREVVRSLQIPAQIWPKRAEEIAPRRFRAVTLRAVEKMPSSLASAIERVQDGGWLAALIGRTMELPDAGIEQFPIPGSDYRQLVLLQIVPRGTIGSKPA